MAEMGKRADSPKPVPGLVSDTAAFSALLEDVSESGDFAALANMADPELFHNPVPADADGSVFSAASTGTDDSVAADSFRDGDFNTVSVCAAVPVSFFCSLCVYPGRHGFIIRFGKADKKTG